MPKSLVNIESEGEPKRFIIRFMQSSSDAAECERWHEEVRNVTSKRGKREGEGGKEARRRGILRSAYVSYR